ncbi:MAG: PASTA domain-containing protein [Candidatus Caldatribacteriota bacterium]|nr:PASTA domain-containing protein [Candidatus Caldatribacteriota bacterium]
MIEKIFYTVFKSIASLLFFLFIFIVAGLSALFVFQNIFSIPNTVVPSVIHDNLEIAQEKIYNAGLKIIISGEEHNNQLPKNLIIKQKPVSGSVIKENREVEVMLSKGRKLVTITIPDLKNKNYDKAVSIIKEYGLILGRVTLTNHFSIPKDQVITQIPEPGDILAEDKKINLLVSNGPY